MKYKADAYMIIDLQYGSTGKGLLAGYLAETMQPDVLAAAWMPNAGHTYINANGRKWIHRMLPNGIVSPKLTTVLLGAGSAIDIEVLYAEVKASVDLMAGKTIIIHPNAAVVLPKHVQHEQQNYARIGSTMKGSGAAIINRIERNPEDNPTAAIQLPKSYFDAMARLGVKLVVDKEAYDQAIINAERIQIEGAQGYSLSIYNGFYPYTTSRDITPHQVLADTNMPFGLYVEVYGTMRTFPIRVANRYNEAGEMIGTSGGCYPDQEEIEWESIGLQPELTTVTKLPRRIFTFSMEQAKEATWRCSPNYLFLNFCNYLSEEEADELMLEIEEETGVPVVYAGWGASKDDIIKRDY